MKFKRVEIQAFKSYLDKRDGTFDFTVQAGQPADLISLYAPNGFGKTSFYDAIDFCMTNNITRFIRDKSLANANNADAKGMNQDGEKQHLLRAKNAPENLKSQIKIITDAGEFDSQAIKARAGYKDYAFDDSRTKNKQRYFRRVMQSQESIDGFLRQDKPESRYERFMEEQLGGDDTFEQDRQRIQVMLRMLSKRVTDRDGEVSKIDSKNAATDIDVTSLTAINALISTLNELDCEFSAIDDSFNHELKDRLLLQIAEYEQSNNEALQKLLTEKNQQENLLNKFPVYKDHYNQIGLLNKKIITQLKQQQDVNQFQTRTHAKNILMEQLDRYRDVIAVLKLKEQQLPMFVEINQSNQRLASELMEANQQLTLHEQTLKNKQAVLGELENQKAQMLNGKQQYISLKNNAPVYFEQITLIERKIERYDNAAIAGDRKRLEAKTSAIKTAGVLLKSFSIDDLEAILTSQFNNERLADIAKEHATTKDERQNLDNQLAGIHQQLNAAKQQEETLTTLLELGAKLINHNQDRHCPLCQHDHQSFAVLAEKINTNSSLSDTQRRLFKTVETFQTQISKADGKLKQLSDDFAAGQKRQLADLREQFQDLLEEKQVTDKRQVQFATELEHNTAELNRLKGLTAHKTLVAFTDYIDNETAKVSLAITTLEGKIDEANAQAKKQADESVQPCKIKLAKLQSQTENPSDSHFLNDFFAFLTKQEIPLDIVETKLNEQALAAFITRKVKINMGRMEGQQREQTENTAALDALYSSYSKGFFDATEEKKQSLAVQLTDSNNELMQLNELIREFTIAIKHLGKDHLLDDGDWVMLQQAVENNISACHHSAEGKRAATSGLQSLRNLSAQVVTYIEQTKSIGKLTQLNLEIKKCEKIKAALTTDLQHINASLKEQIDRYFHVEQINTIYRKIDPNPDFKQILFKAEFPDEGKPKLQVYITDEEGQNIISPTLSFSSAQVNVLSLSIFLAQALNVKDASGNDVECIFIDDPVQSMDAINVLGVIDLLRNLSSNWDKQIIIATHDENFHDLLQKKLPPHLFKSKFLELESFGKVAAHAGQ